MLYGTFLYSELGLMMLNENALSIDGPQWKVDIKEELYSNNDTLDDIGL